MEQVNLAIIGSGPAGLTAAIYTGRAELYPVVFEGSEPGGQLITTTVIENFPGFPEGIHGPELMENIRRQAEKFGTRLIQEEVISIELKNRPFIIHYGDGQVISACAIIVATGASAKWLGLESERKFRGRGVSSCATCDGFFYKGKKVAVVGGGDTAMEDALHLTRFATEVVLIHRREGVRASKFMHQRALDNPKIKWQLNSVVTEVLGTDETGVTGVALQNTKTGESSQLDLDGLFVAIGHHPNTEFLKGQLPVDDNGFLKVEPGTLKTKIPGVFAAGDILDAKYRQAITAAGMGCMAALEVQEFLMTHPV